jgi:hypothetical protein
MRAGGYGKKDKSAKMGGKLLGEEQRNAGKESQ